MRWEALEEDRELKEVINKIDYILFKYFKGTIKEAIDEANKADFLESYPDLSVEDYNEEFYGFITDDELPKKFANEQVFSKIALLGEVYRRMNNTHNALVLKELDKYQFVDGILTEDDLDYLCLCDVYHYMVEYVLDNIEIPEQNLYPLPEKLAEHLIYGTNDEFDPEKTLIINSGLGKLVLLNEDGDNTFEIRNHVPGACVLPPISWKEENKLAEALTIIRLNARYAFLYAADLVTDKYSERYNNLSVKIEDQDAIIYLSDKLNEKKEDTRIAEIYNAMKPDSRLVTVVNSSWLKHPFERNEKGGLAQCYKDESIVSVTELPKGIWRETEESTAIIVIWKLPCGRDEDRVLFVDGTSCISNEKNYAIDSVSLSLYSVVPTLEDDSDDTIQINRYKSGAMVDYDEIKRNEGYLIPALYLNQLKLEEVKYGKSFWMKFDNFYENRKLENCIYSKEVIFSVLLHLFEAKGIEIIRSGEYVNDDEERWQTLLSISGKDFANRAGDDDFRYSSEREEDTCEIVVDRTLFAESQFIQSVVNDLVKNEDRFKVYNLVSFLWNLRLEPMYNFEVDESIFENGVWCYDIFCHIFGDNDIFKSSTSEEITLLDLIRTVMPESDYTSYNTAVEFARFGVNWVLLPSSIEPYQFDLYSRTKVANMFFSARYMDLRYPCLKLHSVEQLYIKPFFGASYVNEEGKTYSLDLWSVFMGLKCLSDNGRLFGFFPASILTSNSAEHKALREFVSNENKLDRVVLLPQDLLPQTSINLCLVEFRNGRGDSDTIKMIDARECYTINDEPSKFHGRNLLELNRIKELLSAEEGEHIATVTKKNIVEDGYSWSPIHYCTNEVDVPEGHDSVRFEEIATLIRGARIDKKEKGYSIQISDLCSSPFDYNLVTPEIKSEIFADIKQIHRIEEPVLLLSSVRGLRPTFCDASKDHPLYLGQSIYAFRIKEEKICLPYLIYYLSQIDKSLSQGNYIPRNSLLDIKSLKIVFPKAKDAQLAVVTEAKRSFQESQLKELGLLETIEKMKADYINEVRMRKHDMKPHMSQLRNSFKILSHLVSRIEGNEKIVASLKEYLDRQKAALDIMSSQLKHLSDEDVFGEPEILNLDTYFSQLKPSAPNYKVIYRKDTLAFEEAELTEANVKISSLDLSNLVTNIMGNALQHGFTDSSREDYFLKISLSVEGQNFVITFGNNGTPFPDGIDKLRYGLKGEKGGSHAGTGVGGYRVRTIAEHYGGDYDLRKSVDDVTGDKLSCVILTLPICFEDE